MDIFELLLAKKLSGSGGGGGGGIIPSGTKTITSNGNNIDVYTFAKVNVNVPNPSTGKLDITTTSEVDVTNYASAQVVDADLVASNIKKDVNILGVVGTYEGSGGGGSDTQLKALIDGSITSIDWPSGLTNIMPYAFYNRSNLIVANFIDSIVNIGERAFQGVNSITAPTLPSSLTTIGAYAFYGTDISVTTLPDSLTSIGLSRFNKCGSLTSITCNGQITDLGNNAFYGDNTVPMQLREARFPNMALELLSTSFGSSTVTSACKELELLDIGMTKKLNAYCLGNCRKLTKLIMRNPNMVTFNTSNSVQTAFTNSGMDGYGGATGKIYVPSALISTYQNDTNWQTILNRGHLTFASIEGSPYELS